MPRAKYAWVVLAVLPIARYRLRNAHQRATEIVPEMIRRSKNGLGDVTCGLG
jgi:hypothetical protein